MARTAILGEVVIVEPPSGAVLPSIRSPRRRRMPRIEAMTIAMRNVRMLSSQNRANVVNAIQ
jgi:hypothetical protein